MVSNDVDSVAAIPGKRAPRAGGNKQAARAWQSGEGKDVFICFGNLIGTATHNATGLQTC